MREIDLEPKRHSHLYEIKPMSRWWFALCIALVALGVANNGVTKSQTWALVVFGVMLGFSILLVFPKKWLSKLD